MKFSARVFLAAFGLMLACMASACGSDASSAPTATVTSTVSVTTTKQVDVTKTQNVKVTETVAKTKESTKPSAKTYYPSVSPNGVVASTSDDGVVSYKCGKGQDPIVIPFLGKIEYNGTDIGFEDTTTGDTKINETGIYQTGIDLTFAGKPIQNVTSVIVTIRSEYTVSSYKDTVVNIGKPMKSGESIHLETSEFTPYQSLGDYITDTVLCVKN